MNTFDAIRLQRLWEVSEAARALRFAAYPAHGSGFITMVTEGNIEKLRNALRALDDLKIQENT